MVASRASEALREKAVGVKFLGGVLRFSAGFVLGVLALPFLAMTLGLAWVAVMSLTHPAPDPPQPFRLVVSGRDVSESAGAVIFLKGAGGVAQQRCRGTCDDLRLEDERGELDTVRVLDGRGACIACLKQPRSGGGRDGSWWVSGAPKLVIAKGTAP